METQTINPDRKLITYFLIVYAIMLLTWGSMAILGLNGSSVTSQTTSASSPGLVLLIIGMFSPTISAFITTQIYDKNDGIQDLLRRFIKVRISWKWYLISIAVPLIILAIRIFIYLISGKSLSESALISNPVSLIGFTISIAIMGPLSEEFGWRGFAIDNLLKTHGIFASSLILGIIWGFWHLPLFFIKGTIQQLHGNVFIEFPIFILTVMGLTVYVNWIYIKSGRSIFAAILAHFAFNWIYSFSSTLMSGGIPDRLINSLCYFLLGVVILAFQFAEEKRKTALSMVKQLAQDMEHQDSTIILRN